MLAWSRRFCLLFLSAAVSGCALPYYWQAVGGQLQLLRQRTPIERVLTDPGVDDNIKAALRSVADIRHFAVQSLELPDNGSYTSYVDLERSYVVWNVIAAEEFSVDPVQWCFPFAGCVSYRGYFARDAAERFEAEMRAQGYDTYSGGATAYSTLGYFADPVLSTMLEGGEQYVAALLFHELAHQRLYVKDASELNEAFATAIEEYGMEVWLTARGDAAALAQYRDRMQRRAEFGALIARQQVRLRAIYETDSSDAAKREEKRRAFAELGAEYESLKQQQWRGAGDYDAWFEQSLNNASLAAVATYRQWLPALRYRLEELGLGGFYADMERLAELPLPERERWLGAWSEGRSAPRGTPES